MIRGHEEGSMLAAGCTRRWCLAAAAKRRSFTCALSPAAGGNVSEAVYPVFEWGLEGGLQSAAMENLFLSKVTVRGKVHVSRLSKKISSHQARILQFRVRLWPASQ